MTTRSVSINTPLLTITVSAIGGDGKYETVGGKQRIKWNNYTLSKDLEKRTYSTTLNTATCNCLSNLALNSIFRPNDVVTVQSKLSEAIKGHDFNLAVNVAQGKQAMDMALNAVTAFGGAILDLKRGNFASAARRLGVPPRPTTFDLGRKSEGTRIKRPLTSKDLAGRWLELQYGWLPTLSDVHEAWKAYESITNGPRTLQVSAHYRKEGEINSSCSPSNYTGRAKYKAIIKIKAELYEGISTPRTLGLLDPATVVWEIIPYSFVVDWFIPIGTYLENLNILSGLKGRFLTTRHVQYSNSLVRVINPTYYKGCTTSGSGVRLERSVSTTLVVAKPGVNSLPDALSPKRILNAIALVRQRFN